MNLDNLPCDWSKSIRTAVLNVVSMAHLAIIQSRSWSANSSISRVRLAGKCERATQEIALLKEELRIKDSRMSRIPPHHRPFYQPVERLAILELKAARGWNLAKTAAGFLVQPDTIAEWMRRIEDDSLVRLPQPINKFPPFVRHVVQRLKLLCPAMGRKKIAEILARAGLRLSASSVSRFLKNREIAPPSDNSATGTPATSNRVVSARHPNHVWHVDLTVMPTSTGFWTTWFPLSLPQVWPFCYWIAVIVDHFSRKVMGCAVFRKQPASVDIRSFLGRIINLAQVCPKYLISDRGKQFDCNSFRKWTKRRKIKLRYGAIGRYGSIAVIERFILSMKSEFTNHLLIPFNMDEFQHELANYAQWYNYYRPHEFLDGHIPQEIYSGIQPQAPPDKSAPNSRLPKLDLLVSHLHGNRLLPIVKLRKAA